MILLVSPGFGPAPTELLLIRGDCFEIGPEQTLASSKAYSTHFKTFDEEIKYLNAFLDENETSISEMWVEGPINTFFSNFLNTNVPIYHYHPKRGDFKTRLMNTVFNGSPLV